MSTDHRLKLTQIKRFDQLIAYLRDEMGWPIARDSFDDVDDLFYEFSAEELGIDPKTSAKILEIKRLRPLSPKQPWGIFFVKFEPKKLPVIALRRILGQVALKRRSSANSPDRTAWSADDLLFISNYGDGDARQISFAHFSKSDSSLDLPTLRVLGWNNLDTGLHLDAVAKELTENLTWPEEGGDLNQWRKSWSDAFKLGHNEVINTAKDLSIRLAELASSIRDRIKVALSIENDSGPLTILKNAFKSSLVNDLDNDSFADMYAQTIAYGLLSARITDPSKKTVDDFTSHMRTSPFLRELMETFLKIGGRKGKAGGPGIDFDELGVGDVIQLLDNVNIEAVLRDFGDKNRQEDPVMHFFEGFLQAYDKKIRKDRGVFYTPQPVVSYIVRSVHELLQTEFGLVDGLADIATWGEMLKKYPEMKLPPLTDEPGERRTISPTEPFVQILDPATGTATFLIEVIEVIHQTLSAVWKQQRFTAAQQLIAWNEYVPKHLLPRLHAFELMMAPYAIAHMKVGLKLAETGYLFATEERARIYLTNALEPYQKQLNLPELDALAHEAASVNEIKRTKSFTVVIGNPPYSGISSNTSKAMIDLVEPYKSINGVSLGERKIWTQDDYKKFIRFSQLKISNAGFGIVGVITNNGFINEPTSRGMRHNLLATFPRVSILDLHGSLKKREVCPDGSPDKNVFDIEQGVAISFLRCGGLASDVVSHSEIWGLRESKYNFLLKNSILSTPANFASPTPDFYLFVPQNEGGKTEFGQFISITEIFASGSNGIQSSRDHVVYSFNNAECRAIIEEFRTPENVISTPELREKYWPGKKVSNYSAGDTRGWSVPDARHKLRQDKNWETKFRKALYRPFDFHTLFYADYMIDWPRSEVMSQMLRPNLSLCVGRAGSAADNQEWNIVFVSNALVDMNLFYRGGNVSYPLRFTGKTEVLAIDREPQPNFKPTFLKKLSSTLSSPQKNDSAMPAELTPEDIFNYAYSVFYSPSYRSRYAEFLKIDYPRLPLTGNLELFHLLAEIGGKLIALHLLEFPLLGQPIIEFVGNPLLVVEKISWSSNTVWVDKAQTTGFESVHEDVWNFHVGGYQVCEKWLKDRKGRSLSKDDIINYKKLVIALTETIRLMADIDKVVECYGGWPKAFQSSS